MVAGPSSVSLWILVIQWNPRKTTQYHLIAFPESQQGPLIEIHRALPAPSGLLLQWRYRPSLHDQRNDERRAYFEEATGSVVSYLDATLLDGDLNGFLDDLFYLADCRNRAHALDPIRPVRKRSSGDGEGFSEGRVIERWHLARERDPGAVRAAKAGVPLVCVCCGFDFEAAYGDAGRGFIEVHHTRPLSAYDPSGEETRTKDLVLVCANCHRILHRRRPWLTVEELQAAVAQKQGDGQESGNRANK